MARITNSATFSGTAFVAESKLKHNPKTTIPCPESLRVRLSNEYEYTITLVELVSGSALVDLALSGPCSHAPAKS